MRKTIMILGVLLAIAAGSDLHAQWKKTAAGTQLEQNAGPLDLNGKGLQYFSASSGTLGSIVLTGTVTLTTGTQTLYIRASGTNLQLSTTGSTWRSL